jgi:hypothetical protein
MRTKTPVETGVEWVKRKKITMREALPGLR